MERTQADVLKETCRWLREQLKGMKLKRPRRMPDGSIDDEHVDWAQVEVFEQYIPLETAEESVHPELNSLTRCPSATVILRNMTSETSNGAEILRYDMRIVLLTYDPGVRPVSGRIDLPDAQGWISAFALSDRIVLALRKAGMIGDGTISGIKATVWEQSGVIVDARPMYRMIVDFSLEAMDMQMSRLEEDCDLE